MAAAVAQIELDKDADDVAFRGTFLMPSLVALLDRRFWWPVISRVVTAARKSANPTTRRVGSLASA